MLGEAPDTTAVASALVTVAGSGASGSLSTTLLLSTEEMLDALGQTRGIADRPPAADRTEPQPHRRRAPGQLGVSTLDLASLHPGSDPEGA